MTMHDDRNTGQPYGGNAAPRSLPDRFPGKSGSSILPMLESSADAILVVNAARRIVFANRGAAQLFGYPADCLREKPLELLLPSALCNEQRRLVDRFVISRITGRRLRIDLHGVREDGTHIQLNASISRMPFHGKRFVMLSLQPSRQDEATPVARLAAMRQWAVSTQQAHESEKRRFSRKLYDDIGQRLSVLKLDLDWLENTLPGSCENLPERVARMQGLLDNVIAMTKSVASALRPPLLDDFGLVATVEWMAEKFRKKTGIHCTIESKGLEQALSEQVETAAFRLVQESLLNIERQANAHNVRVVLTRNDHRLDVMIQDDGVGVASNNENKPDGEGLTAMQERIFILGGTVRIQNVWPQGLAIHAAIPL